MKLTDEQLLNLKTVLIEGNKIITAIEWSEYTSGRGGSNYSGCYPEVDAIKPLDGLAGKEVQWKHLSGMGNRSLTYAILAVVDDVIYLGESCNGRKVIKIPHDGRYRYSTEIAYDTEMVLTVLPVCS